MSGGVRAQEAGCQRFDLADVRLSIEGFDVIVVGALVNRAGSAAIAPEVYLKGPATARTLVLAAGAGESGGCPLADLPAPGARVLAALQWGVGGFAPPVASALFLIEDGVARSSASPPAVLPEADLVARIRAVTGQIAVPAADPSQGVSLDWRRVVLPVAGSALAIFVVALALMRIWHRIDPT